MVLKKQKAKSKKLKTTMFLCDQCYPKRVWETEMFDNEIPHACAACGNTHLTPIVYSFIHIEYDPNTEDQNG
jgi:hypothetical protein